MIKSEEYIRERLFALADDKYRLFQCRLMPTVEPERVIGVRTPQLRALAKELAGTEAAAEFISILPHGYYDENNLHGFIISLMRDFDAALSAVDAFLPYVDNWATCDLLSPKCFAKNTDMLYPVIKRWLCSEKTYTVRFAEEMLMSFYLSEHFDAEQPRLIAALRSEEYYINMMTAWYFATALAKRWNDVILYIENGALDTWTHNKAIQKACESYRITGEQKEYLKSLKRAKEEQK